MPCPHSLRGAGPAEGAPSLRLPVLRVHLAVRRCSQRPNIDRMALDFRQSSFRHVTRVSPSNGFSVFSPFPALSAGSCPLALSGSGKPLTQGCPLNPSHLRWGCCMNYRGAPEAIGGHLPGKGTGYPAPSPQTRTCAMNASGSSVATSLRHWRTKQATPRLAHHCAGPGPARCGA
jgi:hypothetical protein